MVARRTLLKGLAAGALVYPALPWRWLAAGEQPASGDLAFLSASRLSELIQRREIGALELLDLYLERIQQFNPQLDEQSARRLYGTAGLLNLYHAMSNFPITVHAVRYSSWRPGD